MAYPYAWKGQLTIPRWRDQITVSTERIEWGVITSMASFFSLFLFLSFSLSFFLFFFFSTSVLWLSSYHQNVFTIRPERELNSNDLTPSCGSSLIKASYQGLTPGKSPPSYPSYLKIFGNFSKIYNSRFFAVDIQNVPVKDIHCIMGKITLACVCVPRINVVELHGCCFVNIDGSCQPANADKAGNHWVG